MISWHDLEFLRARRPSKQFHVHLRPKTVWYDSPTFHAAVFSTALHVGLLILIATDLNRFVPKTTSPPQSLWEGETTVVFLSPEKTPLRLREKLSPFRSGLASRSGRSVRPIREGVTFSLAHRAVSRRSVNPPNRLLPVASLATSVRLPEFETASLSLLSPERSRDLASVPLVAGKGNLPEPLYDAPGNGYSAGPSERGDVDETQDEGTPSDRRRREMGRSLREIAQTIVGGNGPRAVDVVFLLDVSGSMDNNIRAVAAHLVQMMAYLQERGYDATFGVVRFKVTTIRIFPQTRDAERLRRLLESFQVGGDEYALDALEKAARKVQFREGVERRFILITDEPLKGTVSFEAVLSLLRAERIVVDVVGLNDTLHRQLASQTGGTWHPIPGEES